MRAYTTPTLNITIKRKDGTAATDLDFTYLIFTLKGGKVRIDKRIEVADVEDGVFTVTLTQEETGSLPSRGTVFAEINFFSGSTRTATLIKQLDIDDNLIDEVVT